MFGGLMISRRFAPLFWCQFLSAFNDNFVRQMLMILILFRFGGGDAGSKVTLAIGIFILPSMLLSALGGELADSHDKALVARRLKFAEIFVQLIAASGFYFSSLFLLYLSLFGLGIIAALFGPIKYGILPDHLRRDELVSGNALVEGATFAAIICGLIAGGFAATQERVAWSVVLQLAVVGLACWVAACFIRGTRTGAPGLKINPNILASTRDILRELKRDSRQWVGAAGVSWFWLVGAVALSLAPVVVKSRIGGGVEVETAINLFFAIGIAVGSLLAAISSPTAASSSRLRRFCSWRSPAFLSTSALRAGRCRRRLARSASPISSRAPSACIWSPIFWRCRPFRACSSCRSLPPCRLGPARIGAPGSLAPSIR
jgi:acyl-[acyl-carrier-protein]-phospholipid O-acyltransferase/long-chain-fatty-acid--[acyl-carrier-protein] ligase